MSREKWEIHGVYEILNLENGKRYIGSAAGKQGIEGRIAGHVRGLRANRHYNRHLQNAWNRYGEHIFALRPIFHCSMNECVEFEQYFIDQHPWDELYNLAPKAGSALGVKHSEEARKVHSARAKAMHADPVHKEKRSARSKAMHADPVYKAKHSARMKAMTATAEWKAQQSASSKSKWANPAYKAKNVAHLKTLNADPEWRAKHSARMKSMNADPEWSAKRSARMKIFHADPERKAKMAAKAKAMWADPAYRAKQESARQNRKRNEIQFAPLQS